VSDAASHGWPLVGAATMRALDRYTIEALGVPGELLMESAGRAVAEVALGVLRPGGSILVVAGAGNNGGDGLVAARHLHLVGVAVRVVLVGDPAALRGDAGANLARARAAGVSVEGPPGPSCGPGDVVVDALFGTGLARPVEGEAAHAIARISAAREAGARVVSVDLPSGLDTDTGQVLGCAVAADVTVACGLPKLALALEPGRSHAGRVLVARIGIADAAPGVAPDARSWSASAAAAALPARPQAGHKGTFGHVLVIAGSRGKAGAAILAARGALRAGSGLVTVACPEGENAVLQSGLPEAMSAPLPETAGGGLAAEAVREALALASARDVLAVGPGLGTESSTQKAIAELVARADRPLVLDADGLNAVAAQPDVLKARRAASILTPHPGEAARFLGLTAADVNRDRVGVARSLAARTGAVIVLKGAATVVAAPGGRVAVNPTGGAALGTGGTGDVLCGVVAGLLAQGMGAFEAAATAVYVHGLAGDRWQVRHGAAGLRASELADAIPDALRVLRDGASEDGEGGPGGAAGADGVRDGEAGEGAECIARDAGLPRSGLLLPFPEP